MPLYNNFKEQLLLGAHNLDTATLKVTLHAGYTPDIDAHDYFDDVVGTEESGTGYSAGGVTVANSTVTQDNTNDRAVLDGDNVVWSGLNVGTPSHAILRVDTGANATSTLIGYWAVSTASNGGDYTLAFDSIGILTIS